MEKTRLSQKGQVVIPSKIRHALGWDVGTEFAVEMLEDGIALRPLKTGGNAYIDEVFGSLVYNGKRKSLRDMEEGIRKGAQRKK